MNSVAVVSGRVRGMVCRGPLQELLALLVCQATRGMKELVIPRRHRAVLDRFRDNSHLGFPSVYAVTMPFSEIQRCSRTVQAEQVRWRELDIPRPGFLIGMAVEAGSLERSLDCGIGTYQSGSGAVGTHNRCVRAGARASGYRQERSGRHRDQQSERRVPTQLLAVARFKVANCIETSPGSASAKTRFVGTALGSAKIEPVWRPWLKRKCQVLHH